MNQTRSHLTMFNLYSYRLKIKYKLKVNDEYIVSKNQMGNLKKNGWTDEVLNNISIIYWSIPLSRTS